MIGARGGFDFRWTRENLAAILGLCVICGGLLAGHSRLKELDLGEHLPVYPDRVRAGAERINPNVAGISSLRRLPGIGPRIAERIVDHRRGQPSDSFRSPGDLEGVKGIGKKTVARIAPLLTFDATIGEEVTPDP